MDKLLELLEKYRCHLKRDKQSMGNFLEANYRIYIENVKDLKNLQFQNFQYHRMKIIT